MILIDKHITELVRPTLRRMVFLLAFGMAGVGSSQQVVTLGSAPASLRSPDNQLEVSIGLNPESRLIYSLHRNGSQVLGDSPMGITVDGVDLGTAIPYFVASDPTTILKTYPKMGVSEPATDHHNLYKLTATRTGPGDPALTIEFRVFNDGLAFRYLIPGNVQRSISGEATGWNLLPASTVWYQPDTVNYDADYRDAVAGTVDTDAGGPITVSLPNDAGYLLIAEASLFEYSGMSFDLDAGGSTLVRSEFLDDQAWTKAGGFFSPWRVTLATDDLDTLANSEVFAHLNPAPKPGSLPGGAETHWIKPGRVLGWGGAPHGPTPSFESYLGFIDYAHMLGFEYILVEKGWETSFPNAEQSNKYFRLAELCRYGRSDGRNVGVWVAKDWSGITDKAERGDFLFWSTAVGAVGVKLDGMGSESSEVIDTYRELLSEAGVYQLMINLSGGGKSGGESRTFPNEMSRGGVRGTAASFAGAAPVPARHNAILPFTRFVPGPPDFAPVVLEQSLLGGTTFAHQLATGGIFSSPFSHWPEHPERYLAVSNALDVIYEMPNIWDETRILSPSRIGELVAMARRKGDNWFLFLLNGNESQSQPLPLFPLSFLHEGTYDAVTLGDLNQTVLARTEHVGLTAASSLNIALHPGGGFVGMFIRRPDQVSPTLDSDGDGIPDLEDCAPHDPELSSLHTFYPDVDRDHFGNRLSPVRTCSSVPHPPLVAWGDDPNDLTMFIYPVTIPKGDRMLGIDNLQTPASGLWKSNQLAELGAQVAPIRLTWGRFETNNGTFDGPEVQQFLTAIGSYAAAGLKTALVASAFQNGEASFPLDLQTMIAAGTLSPNDPLVASRFAAWLDHLATLIDRDALHSLQIGEPLNLIHDTYPDPPFWAARLGYFNSLKTHAESLWGQDLPVFQTASHNSILSGPGASLLLDQLEAGDVAGILFQPHLENFTIIEPENLRNDLEQTLSLLPDRQIYLIDVAYPSLPAVLSSETKQSQSLRALFEFWDLHADRIPFVSLKQLFDPPSLPDPAKRSKFYASLGLRTHDDQPKAAYKTLRNLTYERGWWQIPPPKTRSFRMGFSQTQYDESNTVEERNEILSWMLPQFEANSDISCIQIDIGLPWVEALADDFSSLTPPYHETVLFEWGSLKEAVAPNQPLVVAISPIGNPRSHISAYWGEAEGYYFQRGGFSGPEFVRVADGVVEATRHRYPPAPWDTIPLNSPEVKSAYLKYCIRVIEYFQPEYLLTALEASATLVEDPERYDQLVDLMKFIYESLKADPRYRDIPQVISISTTSFIKDEYGVPYKFDEQADGVFEAQIEGLSRLLPYMDFIGLSNYPHFGKYNAYKINASMYDSLFESIERAGGAGKPIVVSESGYSADPFQILERPFLASPQKQDDYFKNLFYALEKSDHPVEYVINWSIRDNDQFWQRAHNEAVESGDETAVLFSQFNQYFRDIGLYDGAGSDDRPALARWQALLEQPIVPKELLAAHPSYLDWAITHFPEVREFPDLDAGRPWAMFSDADGDGRLNIFEYYHASNPREPDSATPMRIMTENGDLYVELPLNLSASDVEVEIQSSLTLQGDWIPLTTPRQILSGPDAAGKVLVRFPVPPGLGERAFFRLEARLAEP